MKKIFFVVLIMLLLTSCTPTAKQLDITDQTAVGKRIAELKKQTEIVETAENAYIELADLYCQLEEVFLVKENLAKLTGNGEKQVEVCQKFIELLNNLAKKDRASRYQEIMEVLDTLNIGLQDKLRPAMPTDLPESGEYNGIMVITPNEFVDELFTVYAKNPSQTNIPYLDLILANNPNTHYYAIPGIVITESGSNTVVAANIKDEMIRYGNEYFSRMVTKNYNIKIEPKSVEIKNDGLKKYLSELLGKDEFTDVDLAKITELTLNKELVLYHSDQADLPIGAHIKQSLYTSETEYEINYSIMTEDGLVKVAEPADITGDLSDLAFCLGLQKLTVQNESIDISFTENLKLLCEVSYIDTKDIPYDSLAKIPNLRRLIIYGLTDNSAPKGLENLVKLKHIKVLSIECDELDLSFLNDEYDLLKLTIDGETYKNFEQITKLTKLKWLSLNAKSITDFSFIDRIKTLEILEFYNIEVEIYNNLKEKYPHIQFFRQS